MKRQKWAWLVLVGFAVPPLQAQEADRLPNTAPLTLEGDLASHLVAGVDKFLLRKLDESVAQRERHWKRDFSSAEAYNKSIEPNRKRLAHILGVRDKRIPFDAPELVGTTAQPALVGRGDNYDIYAVRWPAFGDVHGEGLLLTPTKGRPLADIVAIPDADVTPEQLVGLMYGVPAESQYARRLAESGCRVLVPVLIDRDMEKRNGRANLTSREFLYRSAFELGRHLIGYEVQKVLAAVDWFKEETPGGKVGVIGWGEGGMPALYAAALDTRIDAACVSGYFGDRRGNWEQPIDRNVFGLLEQFGDAELAAMVAPRTLVIEAARGPEMTLPGEGGAPARLTTPPLAAVDTEVSRAGRLVRELKPAGPYFSLAPSTGGVGPYGSTPALHAFLIGLLYPEDRWIAAAQKRYEPLSPNAKPPKNLRQTVNPRARQARQLHEIDRHNQGLLTQSPYVRDAFMKDLYESAKRDPPRPKNDPPRVVRARWQFLVASNAFASTPSDFGLSAVRHVITAVVLSEFIIPTNNYDGQVKKYREFFATQVIGRFEDKLLPPNPRSRKKYDKEKWTGYEVVLDVFPDVIAYGVLLLPKDLKPGEKRPVVVCQHGLEGKPEHVITGDHPAYHDFAAKLAERGFITFAPQNLYIFQDRFRTLQRKANPLGKTLFSIMVPQHQQITDWLKTLPYVDGDRIGFYGLSYGGKSAMRIPPLVQNYCLSICSADFNEWVWKNASSRSLYSYVWTIEYEIFEFDLGSTFNYAEMAALIAPRPFMVERGHFDGVAPDETVAYEFAKVRNLYAAKLGLGDRCEIEWFVGPHTINGKGTFDFLHKHLNWPKR